MRIGIFAAMAGRQAAGPETYEVALVRSLAALDSGNEYHVFCLSEEARNAFAVEQKNFAFHVLRPGVRWVSITATLPIAMLRARLDVFHATFIPPPFIPARLVYTLHDLTSFHNPEFYHPAVRWRLNHSIRTGLKRARMILCVSDCVRKMAAEQFAIPLERMTAVHHGVGERFRPMNAEEARRVVRQQYGIDRPYLLFVGQMKTRKNMARILEAFGRFRQDGDSKLALVLAGRRGQTSEFLDESIRRLGLSGCVIEPGHVSDEQLPALYNAAEMLVFPSLFEGFGFPVIEAMACGTPVITSNVSALPEVAGDGAVLVDPLSVDALLAAMRHIHCDAAFAQKLRGQGLERARHFTWKRAAEQTVAAYRQVAAA
jgi:glycosyltransferase involved in cell wall biosynthesis